AERRRLHGGAKPRVDAVPPRRPPDIRGPAGARVRRPAAARAGARVARGWPRGRRRVRGALECAAPGVATVVVGVGGVASRCCWLTASAKGEQAGSSLAYHNVIKPWTCWARSGPTWRVSAPAAGWTAIPPHSFANSADISAFNAKVRHQKPDQASSR